MERKAGRESRRAEVSILAEIISASMVRKATSCWEVFHLIRLFLIDDVWGDKKCLFGVHRYRNSLNADGSTTATVIIAVRWLINGCQTEEDSSGQALVFHPHSVSVESDGTRKASSATFFHRPEANLKRDDPRKSPKMSPSRRFWHFIHYKIVKNGTLPLYKCAKNNNNKYEFVIELTVI